MVFLQSTSIFGRSLMPTSFWPTKRAFPDCEEPQRSCELTRRPCLPPFRFITKRETGASKVVVFDHTVRTGDRAVEQVTAETCAFLDDDASPRADWLEPDIEAVP